jgi:hypothetical protein
LRETYLCTVPVHTISVLVPDVDVSVFQPRAFLGVLVTLQLGYQGGLPRLLVA